MDAVKAQAQALADQIAKASLVIKVRVGEGNKMYGSVTPANIAEALEAKGVAIDRRKLVIDEPLRALGDYTIEVKLHPDVRGELKVSVVAHDAGQAAESEGAE
jgi:large subunit ribosomal protein L9